MRRTNCHGVRDAQRPALRSFFCVAGELTSRRVLKALLLGGLCSALIFSSAHAQNEDDLPADEPAQIAGEPPAELEPELAQEGDVAPEDSANANAAAEPATRKTESAAGGSPYEQAYQLSGGAKTYDDYSRIIELCKEGIVDESDDKLAEYYRQLMSWAYNRRGETLADENKNQLAMADFNEAIKLNPNRWQAIHNRAVSYAMQGDYPRALADLDRAIDLKPDYPNARFNRGEIRYEQGEYRLAIDDYNQVIRLSPRDSAALNSRGHAYYKLGNYTQAIRDYSEAIRIEPTNAAAYTNRGDAYADKADFAKASSDYRAAIRIDPNLGRAYQSAAWLLATCPIDRYRDSKLALDAAQKAVELDGEDDFRYLDTLAAAYANAGDFAQARELQTKVVALAPADQVDRYQQRLTLYEEDRPYRDVLATQPQQTNQPTARSGRPPSPTGRNPAPARRQPRNL